MAVRFADNSVCALEALLPYAAIEETHDGRSALELAASLGHAAALELLIARGANPQTGRKSLLHLATGPNCIHAVLRLGIDADVPTRKGKTALHMTVGQLPSLHALIDGGADRTIRFQGQTAAERASGPASKFLCETIKLE